jgi:hypothetical protein
MKLQTSHFSSSPSSACVSFGQPQPDLLPPTQTPSVISVPPQSTSLSPASAIPLLVQESVQPDSITQSDYNHVPKPTWQELEHERQTARIPSSKTPSPVKLAKTGSRSSISPAKIDHEVTKALQESITRALKRHTSEEDGVLNGGRTSKRRRPLRRKVSCPL